MVYRVFTERKPEYREKAKALLKDIRSFIGISELTDIRIINRYDVEGVDERLFNECVSTVFSEPQTDDVFFELPAEKGCTAFAVEYIRGQFDQRADSAAQCIQLISMGERPTVRTATVYLLYGNLPGIAIDLIKYYLINPVESCEAGFDRPETLRSDLGEPMPVGEVKLSSTDAGELIKQYGLAMDEADVSFIKAYFAKEGREPTVAELRVIDTYWSDHCRHTTFNTEIDGQEFSDMRAKASFDRYIRLRETLGVKKPVCFMDMATIAAKYLKKQGILTKLDESEEINACTVNIKADIDGEMQDWLLLFKNETHNHPTEIEPFGGAATCIGGAIRDPLSGRSYVYQAMRVTGASNPLEPAENTIKGKLPQRKIVRTAAQGYSSYGNQIGIATGLVDEVYHDGYVAKHMEIGAVVGAAPKKNVIREVPKKGDRVILLGGRTGRDGCGGATGSSKSHDKTSLASCGAEVQKGNAPEERKLQRLFSNEEAARLIKRCNDFGAGGVSVAIGELADGVHINLDAVPKKYEGLDGTELAISESQERMAVVVAAEDRERFMELAHSENIEATEVARITDNRRMVMEWRGARIVDISRDFLDSNGAKKHANAFVAAPTVPEPIAKNGSFYERMKKTVGDINVCSRAGLAEQFDSTIGAASVLVPFSGRYMRTPTQAMAAKLPVGGRETNTCSVMAYGFDPYISSADPYMGAYGAVITSVCKLIACGAGLDDCYLSFQEYFGKPKSEPDRWGKPMAALLGALDAQLGLKIAAVGGKDSMSGTFENIDVPPTLVSFAIAAADARSVISQEFKKAGSGVFYIAPELSADGTVNCEKLRATLERLHELIKCGDILSAYVPTRGGIAESIFKMCIGKGLGFTLSCAADVDMLFKPECGAFVVESEKEDIGIGIRLGSVSAEPVIDCFGERIELNELYSVYSSALEEIYPTRTANAGSAEKISYGRKAPVIRPKVRIAAPKVLIPVFAGTNCETDSKRAVERAGMKGEIFVINNLSPKDVEESAREFEKRLADANVLFIPGGFSGGDEPDGSAKLIASFMRNARITDRLHELLEVRDGLVLGICNGFQALIKLGLVPFGKISVADADSPTLTYNVIGRHQSRLVRTRVASNKSPWLMHKNVGDVSLIPVSHGEGRVIIGDELLKRLIENGQIATQYCDMDGEPSMDIDINPNGSVMAIEGITSPDGRVFGKMAHSERYGSELYKGVEGADDSLIFKGAADYFMD